MVISDIYRSFIQNKTTFIKYFLTTVDFQAPQKLCNPLSKAVPGKFHGSDRHSKCKCLQDQGNFHRSLAWQIVLIFNWVYMFIIVMLTPRVSLEFTSSRWPFWMKVNQILLKECRFHISVITVPADGLACLDPRALAVAVMKNFGQMFFFLPESGVEVIVLDGSAILFS